MNARGDSMPDYKQMYLTLFRATEQAINTLIQAQQQCEELYISQPESTLKIVPVPPDPQDKPR